MKISQATTLNFSTQHINKCERNYGAEDTPFLNHTSAFFRYGDIDELIAEELKKKNNPLNILSVGCSYGEEVYSFAMALSNLKHKPKIIGIDVSSETVEEAKKGVYMLDNSEIKLLEKNGNLGFNRPRSDFEKEMKKEFQRHFDLINPDLHEYQKKDGYRWKYIY